MSLVFDVLDMTRSAVWLVFGNQHPVSSGLKTTVMTTTASCLRCHPINRIEGLVATRTRQGPIRIPAQAIGANSLDVKRVKLFAAPLLVGIFRQTCNGDLF